MFPDAPEVELLDTRPPRPGRVRRRVLLGAALVVALGGGWLLQRGGGGPGPSAAGSSAAELPPPSRPSSAASSDAAAVLSGELAFDRIGDTLYAVDGEDLVTVDLRSGRRLRRQTGAFPPAQQYRVLADPAHHRVWVVAGTADRTLVELLDPITLAPTGRRVAGGQFLDAALLDGNLYLATSAGLNVLLESSAVPLPSDTLPTDVIAVAADAGRHRLLLVTAGGRPLLLRAVGVRGAAVRAAAPFGKGAVVAAGDRLWAAGFGSPHGVLARLDPATLRVVRHSPVEASVGVGAIVVGADARYLLVRSGGGTVVGGAGAELWCIDAASGAIRHRWDSAPGAPVLTGHGVALLQAGNPLIRLPSGGCRG